MGNTTVRIPQGYQGREELKNKLAILTDNELNFIEYESKPKPFDSFSQRKESIAEAFKFLAKTLLPNTIDYDAYSQWCENLCKFNDDVNFNKKEFSQFLSRLVSIIRRDYPWPSKYQSDKSKEALDMLDRAEQFCILKKGRPDLITLVKIQQNSEQQDETELTSEHPFLIWDEQHSSLSQKTISELKKLQTATGLIPEWFDVLPINIKLFIHFLCTKESGLDQDLTSKTITKVIHDLYLFASGKRAINDFEAIDSNSPPQWFNDLELSIQKSLLFLKKNKLTWGKVKTEIDEIYSCNSDFPTNQNKTEFFRKLIDFPAWYINLKSYERAFLKATLDEKNPEDLSFFCSRFGLIEGLANYGSAKLIDYETMTILIEQSRSSHLVRRDVLPTTGTPENLRQQFTEANLSLLMAQRDLPFLFLQPLNGSGLPFIDTEDSDMAKELARAASSFSPNVMIMRHVLNDYNNWIENTPKQTTNTFIDFINQHQQLRELPLDGNTDTWLAEAYAQKKLNIDHKDYWQAAIAKLKENPKDYFLKLDEVKDLIKEYESILSSTETDNNREIWLANLENEIMYKLGIKPHSFCVSGKDRAQLNILHQFTKQIYQTIYGKRPYYSDTGKNRQNSIRIFDCLFECRHGHMMASYSAPGCDGIKNTAFYLKKDIYAALKTAAIDDVIAGLNELVEFSVTIDDIAPELHSVLKLTAEQRVELFDLLKTIVFDKEFWSDKTKSYQSTPTHVGQMSTKFNPGFFHSAFNYLRSFIRKVEIVDEVKLIEIYKDATEAMKTTSAKRDPCTAQFYEYIVNLFKEGENPAEKFKKTMDNLNQLYKPVNPVEMPCTGM